MVFCSYFRAHLGPAVLRLAASCSRIWPAWRFISRPPGRDAGSVRPGQRANSVAIAFPDPTSATGDPGGQGQPVTPSSLTAYAVARTLTNFCRIGVANSSKYVWR